MSELYTWSKNGMKMILNTDFKKFNKQTNYISNGNVIANTQYSNYIRPYNTRINPVGEVVEKGYNYFDWNLSSGDAGGVKNATEEYNNVVKSLSKSRGNVILMHDIQLTTRDAIESIVKYGLDNGYTFDVLNTSIQCKQATNN